MKNFKKFSLLVLLIINFFIVGCSNNKTIEIKEEVKSPNGLYMAYLYSISSGGATVASREGISIINSEEESPETILLENEPNVFLNNNSGGSNTTIEWIDTNNLNIKLSQNTNSYYIKLQEDIFEEININYETNETLD